ncbi:uncharacterized protein LOC119740696 [Patiria miniata]|uniref:Uncharacterized protein n=1 Tax=Patiria miniata TaxID=46514 RepID=A0A914B718_PATMI|nr:uncharacterized protein LOC119740696 [Patiria miniata]
MEGRLEIHLLLPMAVCIFAAVLLLPYGGSIPSPMHNHQFVYDIESIDHKPGAPHHRVRRKSGRGNALDTSACGTITAVPDDIRTDFPLDPFYQKYTHAYGIPIISSSVTQDAALNRACYTVRFLLADRKALRDAMYDWYGRVGVIAQTERTTQIPEHSHLNSDLWDDRARGLGGIPSIPITTDGEENILCKNYLQDRWYEEDILIHEFAHAIHLISMNKVNASYETALQGIYDLAKQDNLWPNTYAITNIREYLAEGVQGFFNVQVCRSFVDNVHNNICTRDALKSYDRRLYDFIAAIFPCMNTLIDRCDSDQE